MRTASQLNWKGAEWLERFRISPTQFNPLRPGNLELLKKIDKPLEFHRNLPGG